MTGLFVLSGKTGHVELGIILDLHRVVSIKRFDGSVEEMAAPICG